MVKKISVYSVLYVVAVLLIACNPVTTTYTSSYPPQTVTGPTTITINTCDPAATATVTSTSVITSTVTMPITSSTGSVPFTLPEEGIINLAGVGYFYFQRVSQPITTPINFHDVTFTAGGPGPGTTITAPISYWIIAKFQDGTTEELRYIGLGDRENININMSMHGYPRAGVLQGWQQVEGSLRNVLYILVSE